ncbi:conserved hypothetical protein [Talaromyces stipitatus ATCC 10500]|uniref:Transcription factor domain-containing protein n=1 Tax=Talaromyces stipitatus (strain ATCC 10500 / CBS 375.48 / QM 6759 / NRRL 1006) TaxID=441959 RepID=B8MT63_TALSN|nr:uncharacterized protein TSTA_002270 [Talaromyces stipitatus ATCC 10500]EED12160.1 conserved hypothetical protein [Talaromyces stipitatus ATCC 10500]
MYAVPDGVYHPKSSTREAERGQKRKGVDKALHQIEQAIKKSKNATTEEQLEDPLKIVSHLHDLLEKAERQLASRKADQPHSSESISTPSDLTQSQQPHSTTLNTDDGPALDDAENPLQLLARASDLQLMPPTIGRNLPSSSPIALSSPGTTVYSNHSARAVDSFFVPIRASLDVGPELDPVDIGLITFEDANNLFAFFYDHLSHTRWGFDPAIHTVSFVRAQSSFLFTSILAASASFLPSTEALSRRLLSHVKVLAQNVIARRHRSVEIVLAFMANIPWMAPGKRLGDDDTCLYIAMALSIALDLSLNKVATLPRTSTGGQFSRGDCIDARRALSMDGFEDVEASSEYGRRLLRRRERTWIALFVVERGVCLARGRSYSVPVTALLENCDKWHLSDRDIADPRDGQMNSMATLRRDLDELLRKVRRACDDYRIRENGINVARSIESMIESFYDSWFAVWALSISEGDSQSLPPYVEILVTHTRLSTYSSVMNHPTAPTEVRSFFRSEALSSALNVMRTAIQGESRLKSMPNNTVIMIAFAACSALSLGLAKRNQNDNRLAPSVLNLITETADVLERIGATPRHRNGASVLYGRFLHELVARARGQPDSYYTQQQQQQLQPPLQPYQASRNYNTTDPRTFSQEYLPPPNISPATQYSLAPPLQFSSMSGDQIADAVNSVSLPMGEAGTLLPDYQNFPLNEMMLWEWFDNTSAADLSFM